nr:uncharacterized protein LOC117161497 [Bombus vancouverensis nearcticus]
MLNFKVIYNLFQFRSRYTSIQFTYLQIPKALSQVAKPPLIAYVIQMPEFASRKSRNLLYGNSKIRDESANMKPRKGLQFIETPIHDQVHKRLPARDHLLRPHLLHCNTTTIYKLLDQIYLTRTHDFSNAVARGTTIACIVESQLGSGDFGNSTSE